MLIEDMAQWAQPSAAEGPGLGSFLARMITFDECKHFHTDPNGALYYGCPYNAYNVLTNNVLTKQREFDNLIGNASETKYYNLNTLYLLFMYMSGSQSVCFST